MQLPRVVFGALVLVREIALHRRFPAACLIAAALVRLVWIAWIDTQPTSDYSFYFGQGLRIANGQGYTVVTDGFPLWEAGRTLSTPRPTAFWPVGYPAFLAALFSVTQRLLDPLLAAKLANVALYLGLMVASAYCARLIFRSLLASRLTLFVVGFIPNHIAYVNLTAVEIYFVFLIAAAVALLLYARESKRPWVLPLSGLVFGLAALTKPQAVLLPGLLLLGLNRRDLRSAFGQSVAVYAALVLTLLPWTVRNFNAFGRFVFVSNNGWVNLLIGNMPGSFGTEGLMWNRELHTIIHRYHDEISWNEAAKTVVFDYFASHPLDIVLHLPKKLLLLYWSDVDGFGWNRAGDPAHAKSGFWLPLRIVAQGYYMAIVALFSACLVGFRKLATPQFMLGPVIVGYFTLIYLVFFGGSRFHFPMVPWIGVYAAGFLAWLAERASAPTTSSSI